MNWVRLDTEIEFSKLEKTVILEEEEEEDPCLICLIGDVATASLYIQLLWLSALTKL